MVELLLRFVGDFAWLNDVYKTLPSILYAIMAVVGGAGVVYSIILGVNLAKSENDEKRRYAAYRLRNTLIGVFVLIAFILIINLLIPALVKTIWKESWVEDPKTFLNPMLQIVSTFNV